MSKSYNVSAVNLDTFKEGRALASDARAIYRALLIHAIAPDDREEKEVEHMERMGRRYFLPTDSVRALGTLRQRLEDISQKAKALTALKDIKGESIDVALQSAAHNRNAKDAIRFCELAILAYKEAKQVNKAA